MMKIAANIKPGDQILRDGVKVTVVDATENVGFRTRVMRIGADPENGPRQWFYINHMHLVRVW